MKGERSFAIWLGAAFGALAVASSAQATSDQGASPALFARFPHYHPAAGANPDQKVIGPTCTNNAAAMPAVRRHDCITYSSLQHPATGVYRITVENGAPLPSNPSSPLDTGWTLFVSAVGSNARCAETSTSWTIGSPTTWPNYFLNSTITCVNPSGTNVDSDFDWLYRTDSGNYPQTGIYPLDFAYARVNRGSGNQVVASETFTPYNSTVTSAHLSTGQFRVTWSNMNLANASGFVDQTTGMNNVVVQRTCVNDSSADCKRAVCIPSSWSYGTTVGSSTTVDVGCYLGTSPVDVDFRVFIGNQALNTQMNGWADGFHYGWASPSGFGPNLTCKETTEFPHRNQHETAATNFPTLPLRTCRTGTGSYIVDFDSHGGFYSWDQVSAFTTSRTVGAYCNVSEILCGGVQCSKPPSPYVGIQCFDSAAGTPKNAIWNMSMVY